jgi:hypothetical protein
VGTHKREKCEEHRLKPWLLEVADALEDGAYYQWEGYGGVFEDFGELAAFFGWDEFAPAYGFGVGAAAEAAPVDGLGADTNAVVVALEGKIFVAAAGHEFGVDAELLRPVARDAAPDGEDTHFFGSHHGGGESFKILKGIEAEERALVAFAGVLVEGEIEAEFGIGEGGHEDGDVVLVGGFENAATFGVCFEEFADAFVQFPTANNFARIPLLQDAVDDFFDVI